MDATKMGDFKDWCPYSSWNKKTNSTTAIT